MPPQFGLKMSNELVTLNVGGVTYTTTKATLTKYPDSMLGAMFSGRMPNLQDVNGHYFIDRDGALFKHVLNFLRCSKLCLPTDFKEMNQLIAEADFYQIQPMINELLTPEVKTTPSSKKGIFLEVKEITKESSATVIIIGSWRVTGPVPKAIQESLPSKPLLRLYSFTHDYSRLTTELSRLQCAPILKGLGFTFINTYFSGMSENSQIVEVIRDKWYCPDNLICEPKETSS